MAMVCRLQVSLHSFGECRAEQFQVDARTGLEVETAFVTALRSTRDFRTCPSSIYSEFAGMGHTLHEETHLHDRRNSLTRFCCISNPFRVSFQSLSESTLSVSSIFDTSRRWLGYNMDNYSNKEQ